MATQFDEVMRIMNVILARLQDLNDLVDEYIHMDELNRRPAAAELFGDTPFDEADYTPPEEEIISAPLPGATRRWVSYRLIDGSMDRYELQKLDERIQKVIRLSIDQEAYFQLYQGSDGEPRITAEEQIVNQVNMQTPHNDEPDRDTGL